jgi:AcrR family transcriptional regulator
MSIALRKERQRKEVHDAILHSAWDIVLREGWQHLSIRKIADAISYSIPVVYDHFENKEAILAEFTIQGFQQLGDALKEATANMEDATQRLQAIGMQYWDFAFKNKAYYQVMFGLGMPKCESLNTIPELKSFISIIQDTIQELIAEKTNEPVNTWLKVHSYWSMLHGLIAIHLFTPGGYIEGVSDLERNKMVLADLHRTFIKGLV